MKRFSLLPLLSTVFLVGFLGLSACNFGTAPGGTEGEGLTGILVDTHNRGTANIHVRVYPDNPAVLHKGAAEVAHSDSTTTNSLGRFEFKNLVAGTHYNLAASLSRGDTVYSLFIRDILYAGGRQDIGNKALAISGSISLRVLTGASTVTGSIVCRIAGSPFQGAVNDSGLCILTGLPPGIFQIEVLNPDFHIALSDALTVIQGTLTNGGSLELVLISPPGEVPGQPDELPKIAVVSNADVTISSSVPGFSDGKAYSNKNRGKETGMGPGTYDISSTSRALVRFKIPEGYTRAKISRAVIRLTNQSWTPKNVSGPFRIDLHRLLKSWKEGTGTDMTANSATVDGATALERFWGNQDGSQNWSEKFAGLNDIDASALVAASVTKSPGDLGTWDFDVTELVRSWADDSSQNYGVIMAADFPTSNETVASYPTFNTRESAVADSLKPLLILNGEPVTNPPVIPSPRTWKAVTSGTTNTLLDIHFPTASVGYIAGAHTILKTTNAGASWFNVSAQPIVSANAAKSVFFQNADTGWATGGYEASDTSYAGLVKTTNGGATWTQITLANTHDIHNVQFVGRDTGWVVGKGGTILKTVNGGASWTAQNAGTDDWVSCHFINGSTGFVGGSSGVIAGTTNGGVTWTNRLTSSAGWIWNMYFPEPTIGYAVGYSGEIFKTTNSGISWTAQNSGVSTPLRSIHFLNALMGSAAGDAGTLLSTIDGGITWKRETVGTSNTLGAVFLVSPTSVITGGDGGILFKGTGRLP